ncbi:hypothetical protein BMF94_0527 [Rhodotorula taiwanensis]|uniref:Cobalamin-independent methionine synthase MetE C-terminal/archaeal domain-containing protein n=1 Tax=Rhodotorula taiwanensis TaxID=741276 RepID=A0A2S5BHT5_9BASI|nr:hypothetical protein BMF94_0527 [Rhodotorula taiwanensis]
MSCPCNPPFRSEHIGSLKRPTELLAKRAEFDEGKCTREELRKVEDEAIRKEVERQQQVGIKSITDGEFRRHMFWDGFHNNLTGMKLINDPPAEIFKFYVPDVKAFVNSPAKKPGDTMLCVGKLVRDKPMYRPEFEYLKSLVKPDEVRNLKITLAAPEWYHLRHMDNAFDSNVYANADEYFADLAKAYREELADLYDAGCRNVQFDDPLLAYFCSESMLEGMKEEGRDAEALLDQYIKLYNDSVRDAPKDMVIGLHYFKDRASELIPEAVSKLADDRISKKLFQQLNAQVYYLEYDTARAGGFEPLADLPKDKFVVLGLVSSKFPKMEDKAELEKRINEAADFVAKGQGSTREEALKQLAISPQCGFASHSEGNPVNFDDVIAKLQLCTDVAKKVWSDA